MLEEDQEHKHICKFCRKSFPCGRSLGGHMRTHLVTVTSSDHYKSGQNLPKKRLPPLVNGKRSDFLGEKFGGKPNKSLKLGKEDALLGGKHCRECGKSFNSWKALFGHMKCHSGNRRMATTSAEEDSWSNISKQGMDSESDNDEPATSSCRQRRSTSDRTKRYIANTKSSCSTIADTNPSLFDQDEQMEKEDTDPSLFDQDEQMEKEDEAEVALSLIILSRDKGDQSSLKPIIQSSHNTAEFLQPKNIITNTTAPALNPSKSRKRIKHNCVSNAPVEYNHLSLPYSLHTKDPDTMNKFKCSICNKGFPSYQALGGHRASHKKFKGCCVGPETDTPRSDSPPSKHECPICFKVFASGQALGGHRRSHLPSDQTKTNPDDQITLVSKTRRFLDLNLPACDEEECNESTPWWVRDEHDHKLLLAGLLSS